MRGVHRVVGVMDFVLSAFSGHAQADVLGYYLRGIRSIIAAVKKSGVPRLPVVGGAGSLEAASSALLIDTRQFPAEWKEHTPALDRQHVAVGCPSAESPNSRFG